MRIGILQCGLVAPELVERFGEYPALFEALYHAVDPGIAMPAWAVVNGEFPPDPRDCDAWLLTGSRHGVYDPLPFIEPLKGFLRETRALGVPMIGICFGHQIMAEAFGGRAGKSEKGWGVGVHDYRIIRKPAWMETSGAGFAMQAFHQDQVTAVPADAVCLATSPFCEYAMLAYGEVEAPAAISIQPHPEMSGELAGAILDLRAGTAIPMDAVEAARPTLQRPADSVDFVHWSLGYLRRALAARAAA